MLRTARSAYVRSMYVCLFGRKVADLFKGPFKSARMIPQDFERR